MEEEKKEVVPRRYGYRRFCFIIDNGKSRTKVWRKSPLYYKQERIGIVAICRYFDAPIKLIKYCNYVMCYSNNGVEYDRLTNWINTENDDDSEEIKKKKLAIQLAISTIRIANPDD